MLFSVSRCLYGGKSGSDRDAAQQVQFVQHLTGTEHNAVQRVFGDQYRYLGYLAQQHIQVAQECPAAGQEDTLVDDVGRQLGRGLLQADTHRIDDGVDRLLERVADLVRVDLDGFGDAGDQVAPLDLFDQYLRSGVSLADVDLSLKFIAERVEGNLLAAHQEIQKLGLLYPAGQLNIAQIREAVLNVARYDIDGLREALLAGDIGRLTRTLDGLMQEGEPAPLVLWAMSEEIRALTIIRAGIDSGKPVDMLLKDAKVWGPRAVPVKKALQRLNTATLEAALKHAGKIDRMVKGIGYGNIWEEFLRLGLSLCGPASPKTARSV